MSDSTQKNFSGMSGWNDCHPAQLPTVEKSRKVRRPRVSHLDQSQASPGPATNSGATPPPLAFAPPPLASATSSSRPPTGPPASRGPPPMSSPPPSRLGPPPTKSD